MERNIKLLALFNFFTDLKFHSAILILYFVAVTKSYTLGMSIFSITMLSKALFEVPTGVFSDMIGRKKTVVLGAISASFSAIFYALGGTYLPLVIGAIFEGLSRSWYSGNNDALLHDTLQASLKKEQFSHYFGRLSSMFQIALAIGAVVGSFIANESFAIVMWLSVIPQIFCVILALFIKEPPMLTKESSNIFSHIKNSFRYLWKNKLLRYLSVLDILSFGIGEASFQFRAAFVATLWPIWAIGISKMLSFIGAYFSYWFSGKFIKKFGESAILIIANIYYRSIDFLALLFPTVLSPILISSTSLMFGAADVSINSLMHHEFTDRERATLSSLNSLFGSIFYGGFTIILGILADWTGPTTALIIANTVALPRIYLAWKIKQIENR